MSFTLLQRYRRSIYHIGSHVSHEKEAITNLIQDAVRESPSSFNSQSSRVVILYGAEHEALWELTKDALRPLVPEADFERTEQKLDSFKAGYGTILFYEDQEVVEGLQKQFPLYAENFPIWSEQSSGMAQYAVWIALAQVELGASLQHYNPVIDDAVAKRFDIPSNWKLRGQMPFGSIESPAEEKTYIDDATRFRIYG